MTREEIYKRIIVCEKKARDFLEVGNTRTANRYHNEIQKWEELLNQLNPKMEQELNEYRRGYYKQKEVIDKINLIIKGLAYGGSEDYYMKNFSKINELLNEVSE